MVTYLWGVVEMSRLAGDVAFSIDGTGHVTRGYIVRIGVDLGNKDENRCDWDGKKLHFEDWMVVEKRDLIGEEMY